MSSLPFSLRLLTVSAITCVASVASAQPADKVTSTTTQTTTGAAAPVPGAPGAVAVSTTTTTQTTTMVEQPELLHPGFEVGLRAGFAIPLGNASKDNKLSDSYTGMVPIQLDLGYRITPKFYAGLYGQYGIGILSSKVKDACDAANADCTASNIRFGVSLQYHFLTRGSILPWAGVGGGYEIAAVTLPAVTGGKTDISNRGFEFVNVQVGADFVAVPNFRAGPFLGLSVAQYSNTNIGDTSTDIPDKGIHEWFSFGLRGVYNL